MLQITISDFAMINGICFDLIVAASDSTTQIFEITCKLVGHNINADKLCLHLEQEHFGQTNSEL